ncbi:unnamed protein product [Aureobasidium vineae]|uniref:Uncharacterized protein n=1 Tax=Aureobasidium vineae TaxID=2773715 RepID=A0A9N8PBG1_9PEZI|nr:unnamed protein product [Aureobasidium vineae]
MTNIKSLPLELRSIIYDHALSDDHNIITDGIPALLKVCLEITREIYSNRKIVSTIHITHETTWSNVTDSPKHRCLDIMTRFNQKENAKGLLILFKPLTRGTTSRSDAGGILDPLQRIEDVFVGMRADLCCVSLSLACHNTLDSPLEVEIESGDMAY